MKLNKFNRVIHAGRLFQQFITDAYVSVESNRLHYIATHQKDLCSDLYQGICDCMVQDRVTEGIEIGKQKIVLPSTFQGSPRCMKALCSNAMARSRVYGTLDFFIIFTCNSQWMEIKDSLKPGEDKMSWIDRIW